MASSACSELHAAGTDVTPIGDYAVIGDCRAAALISRDGSLDWLCFPRFDSPSIFAALLDPERGGRFRIRPVEPFEADRRYLPDTNVLETTYRTAGGVCTLRDLMPVDSEAEKRLSPLPEHLVLRELEGRTGEVTLEILYEPRPDYARARPRLEPRGALGLWCEIGGGACVLRSDVPLREADDRRAAYGVHRLRAGERAYLAFAYTEEGPAIVPLLGEAARRQVERSVRWWQGWSARCAYRGPYRDAVIRSALALKLMAYAPSGAVVAAPTTSLPESIGGTRNWDYRYCWLRDASFTLRALFDLGYDEEATAFVNWMLHATRLTWPELQVLYDVFGEARVPERELPHLRGHAGSRPVRIGNEAQGQLQLDVYGEVVDAVARFAGKGGHFDREIVRLLDNLGHTVCRRWREPDEGIWEGRSGRQHHTHSKALCWVALDRLIGMHEAGCIAVSVETFRAERDAIRAEIETRGYSEALDSYVSMFGEDSLDASLLTLPLYGYIDAAHPRMRSTSARIRERLGRDGLIYRYLGTDDGLPPGEGAFGIASFWAVECLARGGDPDAATAAFERLLARANDVGLYGEEIAPGTGAPLGNFPQAFTHVGLINAALTLAECVSDPARSDEDVRKLGSREGGSPMNWRGTALWGFVATVVLTGLMSGSHGLGLTRMSLPYMLGTMFTPDRDRAQLVGVLVHVVNGWLFALIYSAAFESWRRTTWWLGALIGLVHGAFVLLAGVSVIPALHPRMASEQQGPTPTRQLEPPGFMALNYGRRTPIAVLLAHLVYGAILGAFYPAEVDTAVTARAVVAASNVDVRPRGDGSM